MWIATHGVVEKFDRTSASLQFVEHDHLLDVVAGESIGLGYQDPVQFTRTGSIPEVIQPRPIEIRTAAPIITEDMVITELPPVVLDIGTEPVKLLVNRLSMSLVEGRNAGIHRHSQGHDPPPVPSCGLVPSRSSGVAPSAPGADRRDPTVVGRLGMESPVVECAIAVSWLPP
jgi:hypothetical protein